MAVDLNSNLYISFRFNGAVGKLTPEGVLTLFAGDLGCLCDSTWTDASLNTADLTLGADNAIYVSVFD